MFAGASRVLDRTAAVFLIVVLAIAIIVPFCNLVFSPSSPLYVPTYLVSLFGKYICYALLALSIDLIWGYCGILSLGHGAFFALGGYAMGMYLMRQIGTRGVYANPILPDFMVFLNWPELPVYWYGFQHFAYAALMVVLVPGTLAFVFGGVGNLWGTLVGAFTLGIANKFLEPYAGAVLGKIAILVLIILFIQKRPRGLFALKGRAIEA